MVHYLYYFTFIEKRVNAQNAVYLGKCTLWVWGGLCCFGWMKCSGDDFWVNLKVGVVAVSPVPAGFPPGLWVTSGDTLQCLSTRGDSSDSSCTCHLFLTYSDTWLSSVYTLNENEFPSLEKRSCKDLLPPVPLVLTWYMVLQSLVLHFQVSLHLEWLLSGKCIIGFCFRLYSGTLWIVV